jgi:DNA repair protein RadC
VSHRHSPHASHTPPTSSLGSVAARSSTSPDEAIAATSRLGNRDLPRERLAHCGARALSDAEIIALLFRTGSRQRDAVVLAHETLLACGGLEGLSQQSISELERLAGVGPAKAATLVAAFELGRRAACRPLRRGVALTGPDDVYQHYAPLLRDDLRERFLVVMLDGRHRVLGESTVSVGTLTASLVHPREVFRPALERAAAAIVLVHNHPSGDPSPSGEDRRVTTRLRQAGELLGIRVVDHVVVADGGFFSFQEAGEFCEDVDTGDGQR